MPLTLETVRPATADEWDDVWRWSDQATYFHSREWADIWATYSHGGVRAEPRLIVFSDGARALLPLMSTRKLGGLIKLWLSSHVATLGGWISADELTAEHAELLGRHLIGLRNLVWKLNPHDPLAARFADRATEPDETLVLDLAPGFEAIHRGWSKGHRAAARQATRLGVTVRLAETEADWSAYDAIYRDSLDRWGHATISVYGPELFAIMAARRSPHIRLWLAEHEERIVAGALCLYARRHVAYWHGAALRDAFALRPVHLLMHDALQDACDREGLACFDFGSSGPLSGVRAFKRSFGPLPRPCPTLRVESGWARLLRAPIRAAGRVLRKPGATVDTAD